MNLLVPIRSRVIPVLLLIVGEATIGSSQGSLQPPFLISPPDSADGLGRTVDLVWHSVLTASGYHLQAAWRSDFFFSFKDTTLLDTASQLSNLDPLGHYWWRVATRNASGDGPWSPSRTFRTREWLGIQENPRETIPRDRFLLQNYPNPFNPSTTIRYALPTRSHVTLTVYDMLGRQVSVLVNEKRDAGVHEVKFDGSGLASGVYFYRLQAGSFVQTRKLLLLR